MDRVEIVFGPGSVMYGSDAIGGVMSFQTKKPVFSSSDQLLVRSSAYMRGFSAGAGYAANAQVNIGSKRFASLTSISYATYGDLCQGNNRSEAIGNLGYRPWYVAQVNGQDSMVVNADSSLQVGSGYKQYDVLQKFSFVQKPGVQHHLNLQLSNSGNIDRYVQNEFSSWKAKQISKYIIREAALADSFQPENCDWLIEVNANRETRLQRVILRSGLTEEEFNKRDSLQKKNEKFPSNKLFLIENNEGNSILNDILAIHEKLNA
jgi:hemoglobin/transferrin/lactoferrin receptor protein